MISNEDELLSDKSILKQSKRKAQFELTSDGQGQCDDENAFKVPISLIASFTNEGLGDPIQGLRQNPERIDELVSWADQIETDGVEAKHMRAKADGPLASIDKTGYRLLLYELAEVVEETLPEFDPSRLILDAYPVKDLCDIFREGLVNEKYTKRLLSTLQAGIKPGEKKPKIKGCHIIDGRKVEKQCGVFLDFGREQDEFNDANLPFVDLASDPGKLDGERGVRRRIVQHGDPNYRASILHMKSPLYLFGYPGRYKEPEHTYILIWSIETEDLDLYIDAKFDKPTGWKRAWLRRAFVGWMRALVIALIGASPFVPIPNLYRTPSHGVRPLNRGYGIGELEKIKSIARTGGKQTSALPPVTIDSVRKKKKHKTSEEGSGESVKGFGTPESNQQNGRKGQQASTENKQRRLIENLLSHGHSYNIGGKSGCLTITTDKNVIRTVVQALPQTAIFIQDLVSAPNGKLLFFLPKELGSHLHWDSKDSFWGTNVTVKVECEPSKRFDPKTSRLVISNTSGLRIATLDWQWAVGTSRKKQSSIPMRFSWAILFAAWSYMDGVPIVNPL